MKCFFLKLVLVISALFLLNGISRRFWPEESERFPLKGSFFLFLPVVVGKDWKFNLVFAALLIFNGFITIRVGKERSEGERFMIFFLLLITEIVLVAPLFAFLTSRIVLHLPLRTSSTPAFP